MTVDPFLAGIFFTIAVENIFIVGYAIYVSWRK